MLALMLALAASPPAELQRIAHEVAALPPGPGGYARDCVWRTEQVMRRLRVTFPHTPMSRALVTWNRGCHSVAGIWIGDDEWIVDGQAGYVVRVSGNYAGRYVLDECDSARRQ